MRTVRTLSIALVCLAAFALPALAAQTGHFERTLKVSGQVNLEVASGSGNITVRTGSADTVQISAKLHSNNGASWLFGSGNIEERIQKIEQNPPIEQTGNSIHVGNTGNNDLYRNISIDYDVTVPAKTQLTARTGSGDQSITGVELPLNAQTGSGNITVDNLGSEARLSSGSGDIKIGSVKGMLTATAGSGNIRAQGVAGEINAHTGSGDVEMRQVSAGNVKVDTGSGNIRLHGIKGGFNARAGSGDIVADGDPTADWKLSAGSGNITLKVPSQASFDIDARTSSGSLKVNHPVTMQGTFAKDHVRGKVGNGGPLVDVHTGSGDIQVD